jgi:hypothetical protein
MLFVFYTVYAWKEALLIIKKNNHGYTCMTNMFDSMCVDLT